MKDFLVLAIFATICTLVLWFVCMIHFLNLGVILVIPLGFFMGLVLGRTSFSLRGALLVALIAGLDVIVFSEPSQSLMIRIFVSLVYMGVFLCGFFRRKKI